MRITWKVFVAFLLTIICIPQTSICTTGMSASPFSITYDSNTWVDIEITGVTPGAEVLLGLHIDVDHDGNLDSEDGLLTAFSITDGQINSIGSRVIVDDDDGVANGEIQTRVSFHGDSIVRIIGAYLWSVTESGAVGPVATQPFEVTQPTSSTWVTGTILDSVSSNPAIGALAIMEFSSVYGNEIRAFADTNGMFRIYAPITVPLDKIDMVFAARVGCLSSEPSFYAFTNSLTAGENSLPTPLNIMPQTAPGLGKIYGHVYDDHTNIVTGAFMNYNGYGFSIFVTDTNGYFEIPVYMDSDAELSCTGVNMMGLMEFDGELYVSGSTNLDIYLPTANVLAKARIADDYTGESLVGVAAEFNALDGEYYDATGYSLDDGCYEIGLVGNRTYGEAEIDAEDELYPLGYSSANMYRDLFVPSGNTFTNAPFWAKKGHLVSGHVYDENTNGISGGFMLITSDADPGSQSTYIEAAPNGFYEVLLEAGSYMVQFHGFTNYVTKYSGLPITVGGTDCTNMNFYLPLGGTISGHVYEMDGLTPIPNLHLWAFDSYSGEQWQYGHTDSSGFYTITLPESDYRINACPACTGQPYIQEDYPGPVSVTTTNNTPDIDFELVSTIISYYQLIVYGGDGSLYHTVGAHATITANTPSVGQVFDRWAGDTQYISDIYEPITTVVMPAATVSVTATYKTDPNDSDGDGILDSWETVYFGHPTNCVAALDADHDGTDNLAEYISGMDPTNFASCFRITNGTAATGAFLIEWPSVSGRVYRSLWSTNLMGGFQAMETSIFYPRNSSTDTEHGTDDKCFYRVEVEFAE